MKLIIALLLLTFPVVAQTTQPSGRVVNLIVYGTLSAPTLNISTTSGVSATGVISATSLFAASGLSVGASAFKTQYLDNQVQGAGATLFINTSANNSVAIGGTLSKFILNAPGVSPAENVYISGTTAFVNGPVTVSNSMLIAQGGFALPVAAAGVTPTTVRKGALYLPNTGGPCYYSGSSWLKVSGDTACTF